MVLARLFSNEFALLLTGTDVLPTDNRGGSDTMP